MSKIILFPWDVEDYRRSLVPPIKKSGTLMPPKTKDWKYDHKKK